MNTDHPLKGQFDGACNRSACQSTNDVRYYNRGSLKFYCGACANMLNTDRFNSREAVKLWGERARLCVRVESADKAKNYPF